MATGFFSKKEKSHSLKTNKRKLVTFTVLAILLLIIDIVLMVIDPVLIIAKYCVRVDYGTYVYEALSEESLGVHVATYLFNVTNADQFLDGRERKLKVQEVGPFTYQEIRKNKHLELDLESRVIRYSPRIRTRFLPQRSVGNPEDLNITMPNLALLSMASKVGSYGFLPRVGFNLLTNRLKSRSIVTMPAVDYLWGYDEPLIRLGHDLVPGLVNFDILGVLDRLYDKKAKYLFELSADEENKFAIKSVNGVKGLGQWGYNDPDKRTACNSFTNTYEGIGYPAEMTSDRTIRIYRSVLCRFLELDYYRNVMTSYGVEGLEYRISNRTYQINNETECLCSRGNCIEGVSDLSPCFISLPVVLSNAHFLYADSKIYERVEGIRPDEEKHGSSFVIEPKIGMVLDTVFTVQVSLLVRDVHFNSEAAPFSDMLVPIVYFKIMQPPLESKAVHNLNLIYFIGPRLLLGIQVLLAASAIGLLALVVRMFYWSKQTTLQNFHPTINAPQYDDYLIKSDAVEPLM